MWRDGISGLQYIPLPSPSISLPLARIDTLIYILYIHNTGSIKPSGCYLKCTPILLWLCVLCWASQETIFLVFEYNLFVLSCTVCISVQYNVHTVHIVHTVL
jgi:hypothetical protein